MPPRVKVTKEEIINTAVELVREGGAQTLNARAIAAVLNCSTQPVFSNFATMDELQAAVLSAVYDIYAGFLKNESESGKYPAYKSFGMAYVRFAYEEKELFKLLFMRDRTGEDMSMAPDFEASVNMLMKTNGISREKAMLIHLEMWSCVHGIGAMIATSFLAFEWELISNMLTDMYQGVRAWHLSKENE